MKASEPKKLNLEVKTADESAEVFIIDGRFTVVERGSGQQNTFSLTPGIYTVKVRAGFESRTENVVLLDRPETVEFERIHFPSSAPLSDTGKTHEYHISAAQRECQRVHVVAGSGSSIFVFVRDWTSQQSSDDGGEPNRTPHRGLKLLDAQGVPVADFAEQSASNTTSDPWAACNVQVDPGIYRLSLELASGDSIEQTVVASSNWQTQVFLLQRNYGEDAADRRADLINASIQLSQEGFNPHDPEKRLVEAAKLGLINTRQVLPEQTIQAILYGKFKNPMLGIFGAHLLLLGQQVKLDLLRIVVDNLRRLLGENQHPDVEALALRLGAKETSYIFEHPPMLRRSWWQVVNATVDNEGLVPLNSMAFQCAGRIWGEEPWLQWKVKSVKEALPGFEILADVSDERVELSIIEPHLSRIAFQDADAFTLATDEPLAPDTSGSKKGLALKGKTTMRGLKSDKKKKSLDASVYKARKRKPKAKLSKSQLRMMVQSSGLPGANVQALFNEYKQSKAASAAAVASDTEGESE
jgi:hypothetical protein